MKPNQDSFFSPNVDRDSRDSFCDILGFHSTPSPMWIQLGVGAQNQEFWRNDLQEWLSSNGKESYIQRGFQWRILFPFAVWSIWKSRNQSVFNGKSQNPRLPAYIRAQAIEFLYCVSSPRYSVCNVIKRI